MGTKRNSKRLGAAALAAAALAAGAMAVHADTFSQRSALGASQDLATTAPPAWPVVPLTTGCASSCDLTLHVGTGTADIANVSLAGGVDHVPFWGFGVGDGVPSLAGAPSSIIKVPQGAVLHITVDQASGTGDPIDLTFPSLPTSDVVKIDSSHYDVTASQVGTSVFQPGLNADAPRQIAMGLVGVLVVTPTGCVDATNAACAFDPTVAYKDEAVVATTTLDPAFAAAPLATGAGAFDMSYFGKVRDADDQPRTVYHVINGQAFPATQVIDVRNGDNVLLRYVNAGVFDSSLGVLGLRQTLLGRNASAYTDAQTLVAPLVGPGETADVGIDIPADAVAGQRYSLMDQGRQMEHGDGAGFGGALTFLDVWAGAPAAPTVTGLSYDAVTGILTGTATPSAPAFPVTKVEYSLSPTGPWTLATGTTSFTSPAPVVLTGASTIYVQATDSNNLVGSASKAVAPGSPTLSGLTYDPTTGALAGTAAPSSPLYPLAKVEYSVSGGAWTAATGTTSFSATLPVPTDATAISVRVTDSIGVTATVTPTAPVASALAVVAGNITGTGTATAGLTVVAAEYFVGADPGAGAATPMTGTFGSNSVGDLSATPATAFTTGDVISVRVKDSFGQWGPVATVTA